MKYILRDYRTFLASSFLLGLSAIIYLILWYLKAETLLGVDEMRYMNSLILFKEGNYKLLFEQGCSIPYLLLNILFDTILRDNLLALRISSLVSAISIILFSGILIFKTYKINNAIGIICLIYILNLFAIRPDLFFGINEYTRDFFGCLIFFIVLKKSILKQKHYILIGVLFGLSILTRQMALSYLLVFLFTVYIHKLISEKSLFALDLKINKRIIYLLIACFCTIILFNSFNLLNYGYLSWENKDLYGEISWAQYDYFNVLKNYNGEISRGEHGSILETKKYLEKNGLDSLPKTFFEMIYFDWKITFHEFIIDYITSLKYLLRLTGFLYFFGIFFLFKCILKREFNSNKNLLFTIAFSFFFPLAISFIVVSNVQPRWFMFFLPLTICSYFIIINFSKNPRKLSFLTINNLMLFVANIPFIYKNFEILI